MAHQENSIWNNYSWTPQEKETETEAPLNFPVTEAPIILEDYWEESLWEDEDEFDEDLDKTGIAD
jgi:hypothetical protein